jgi:WD and tetratricopeptide repeat-containing protein 1
MYPLGGFPSPNEALELDKDGWSLHHNKCYFEAIQKFNEAIGLGPVTASMYIHRASSFLARKWEGDVYGALRDAESALQMDPVNHTAMNLRILALSELGWREEALSFFEHYKSISEEGDSESLKKNMDKRLNRSSSGYGSGYGRHQIRGPPQSALLDWEKRMQTAAHDYQSRFYGHWNTNTDIKEANFLGPNGEFVAAGSDDGNVFIWEKSSGKLVRVLVGDKQITNCIQWHPNRPLLATSGTEHVVRLWQPGQPKCSGDQYGIIEPEKFPEICKNNQRSMRIDPYAIMLMHMGFSLQGNSYNGDSDEEEPGEHRGPHIRQLECRQS